MIVNRFRLGGLAAWAGTLLLLASPLAAQPPSISSVSPQAVRAGESVTVRIGGSNLSGARLWTSFPCQSSPHEGASDDEKRDDAAVFQVSVPDDVSVGVYGIRVFNSRGVSPMRLLVVDDLSSVGQSGGNTAPAAAQLIEAPVAVDGVLDPLSLNYYRFTAEAGQKLSFEVLARRIGSSLDPMIRLLDIEGHELTYSEDEPGLSRDCRLCYTFERAGDYLLELRDIRYQGGGNYFYRLRVGDFPCVNVPYPMSARRGSNVTLDFAGPDVENVVPVELSVPSDPPLEWMNVGARRAAGSSSAFALLAVTDEKQLLEQEPNDGAEEANEVPVGAQWNGRLQRPGDVDRFVFSAKKGQTIRFEGVTRRQGSRTDLVLRLLNAAGSQLAQAEDSSGMSDGLIEQTFPEDGRYTLLVRDLHRRGANDFAYRIAVSEVRPGFTLSATADRLNVPAGGTAMVTVNAARKRYKGPIELTAVNLPEGVAAVPTLIGPGRSSAVMTLTAADEQAGSGAMSEIRLVGRARIGGAEFESSAEIAAPLRDSFAGVPWPPRTLLKSAAVAVAPPAEIALRPEPAEVTFGRDLSAKLTLKLKRREGVNEAVSLAVTPKKNGLPGGVSASLKPIPKGKDEVEISFSANSKASLGEFTAVLVATAKQGKKTVTQPVPGIRLSLQPPFKLTADAGPAKLSAGGRLKLKVAVNRNPAFQGPVELSLQNLPKGVSAEVDAIPADKDEIELVLKAADDVKTGTFENILIQPTAKAGKAKLSAQAARFRLVVD